MSKDKDATKKPKLWRHQITNLIQPHRNFDQVWRGWMMGWVMDEWIKALYNALMLHEWPICLDVKIKLCFMHFISTFLIRVVWQLYLRHLKLFLALKKTYYNHFFFNYKFYVLIYFIFFKAYVVTLKSRNCMSRLEATVKIERLHNSHTLLGLFICTVL